MTVLTVFIYLMGAFVMVDVLFYGASLVPLLELALIRQLVVFATAILSPARSKYTEESFRSKESVHIRTWDFPPDETGTKTSTILMYEGQLSNQERVLGAEHPTTLTTRHELAAAFQGAGRTTEAIAMYEAVLNVRERVLGAEHPTTLATRRDLATAYQEAGRTADAARLQPPPPDTTGI